MKIQRDYVDPVDGSVYPILQPRWASAAGRPLLVEPGSGMARADIDTTTRGLWRYRAAFPVDVPKPVALGVGSTPLVHCVWREANTLFKLEWFSPTGSFKDRGASVMLSILRQQGIEQIIEDSSGNGGAAIAAFGAAAGLQVTLYAPDATSAAKLLQARAYGAKLVLVPGAREASQTAAITSAERGGGFYASHNWQALFLEGTKTLAYELWEDLDFQAPDAVVTPVGAGSSLLGLAMGFRELMAAGQISRMPRLYAAQPLHCSPIDAAFRGNERGTLPRAVLPTIAEGTAIRDPLRIRQIISALRHSGGGTVAVSEAEIRRAAHDLAKQGLYAEPTSATAAAAHTLLISNGSIAPGETVVVILTGSGLKASAAHPEALGDEVNSR